MAQQPTSVVRAVWLLLALVVLGAVTSVLFVVFRDEMAAWSVGYREETGVKAPALVPVALVLYVTMAGLILTLLQFLRGAHGWARWSLIVLVALVALATLGGLRTGPPTVFVVVSVGSLVLDAAILYFLWHQDTRRYMRDELVVSDA
ncbi:MAG: hypothetical protein WKF79_14745 [Nocardioides sp.]